MKQGKFNYFLNFLLLIIFIINIIAAFNRSWREIHETTGYLVIFLVFVHLLIHWRWIIAMTKNIFKKNN